MKTPPFAPADTAVPHWIFMRTTAALAAIGMRFPVDLFEWSEQAQVYRQNRNVLITTSPLALALFHGVRTAGNSIARLRAQQAAAAQWRPLGAGVVNIDRSHIYLEGEWGSFRLGFGQLVSWSENQGAVMLVPAGDIPPLILRTSHAASLLNLLSQITQGRLWRPMQLEQWPLAEQELIVSVESGGGSFSVTLVAGWERFYDAKYLQLAGQDAAQAGQELLFTLRYATNECDAFQEFSVVRDPDLLKVFTNDPQWLERNAATLVDIRAAHSRGVVLVPPRLVQAGNLRGVLLLFTTNVLGFQVRNAELWIPHGSVCCVVGFNVTSRQDPTLWFNHLFPTFRAMMTTWKWKA